MKEREDGVEEDGRKQRQVARCAESAEDGTVFESLAWIKRQVDRWMDIKYICTLAPIRK